MNIKSLLPIACLSVGIVLFAGCSSSPSEQEMAQLDQLKKEVSALEQQVRDQQAQKATIEKQIAEKNAKLKQCQSDQDAVKKSLAK